jgi:hypothetical protein
MYSELLIPINQALDSDSFTLQVQLTLYGICISTVHEKQVVTCSNHNFRFLIFHHLSGPHPYDNYRLFL